LACPCVSHRRSVFFICVIFFLARPFFHHPFPFNGGHDFIGRVTRGPFVLPPRPCFIPALECARLSCPLSKTFLAERPNAYCVFWGALTQNSGFSFFFLFFDANEPRAIRWPSLSLFLDPWFMMERPLMWSPSSNSPLVKGPPQTPSTKLDFSPPFEYHDPPLILLPLCAPPASFVAIHQTRTLISFVRFREPIAAPHLNRT